MFGGCARRAPLSAATWQASLDARPPATRGTEVRAATPSEPGDLYGATDELPRDGALQHGLLACRVSVIGDLDGLDRTPDRIVTLDIGGRESVFHRPDARRWDFSVGLVDLEPGDSVGLRVTDDALGANHVVLQGTERFDGGPLGWTERTYGIRTSVRCRIPTRPALERELGRRLARYRKDGDPRPVAAIVGWSDPRLSDR